jgi:alpha-1,6-mannosyltransferase
MPDQKYGKKIFWINALLSLILYILISYLTPRHASYALLIQYILLFGAFLWMLQVRVSDRYTDLAYLAGFIFRLSLLFLVPNLSDDVYRFIWDGRLTVNGINPYAYLPEHFLSNEDYADSGLTPYLFGLFGKNTHSSYPPLNQLVFLLAVYISPNSMFGSIILIRLVILIAETGNILLIRKILRKKGQPGRLGLLYALNPLIILELTGNLHFEGIMIFFLLLSLNYLHRERFIAAGICLGLGILTKLLPLILLPYLWIRFKKNGLRLVIAALVVTFAGFLPFSGLLSSTGFIQSLALYFYKLEFNASIYFLVRQIGYWIAGFNIIWIAGPLLGLIAFLLILRFSFSGTAKKRQIEEIWIWLLMIYMALTTTLHPWYIVTLAALSLFTAYRFPIIWTFFIFLTYLGYSESGYVPNYWLIALEYIIVYAIMIWEIRRVPQTHHSPVSRFVHDVNATK